PYLLILRRSCNLYTWPLAQSLRTTGYLSCLARSREVVIEGSIGVYAVNWDNTFGSIEYLPEAVRLVSNYTNDDYCKHIIFLKMVY
ncbi:hypothetical protein WA026_021607, partial [Henosepilachna vigintioctopunctata]